MGEDLNLCMELVGKSPSIDSVASWVQNLMIPNVEVMHSDTLSQFKEKYSACFQGIVIIVATELPENELDWKNLEFLHPSAEFLVCEWDRDIAPFNGLNELESGQNQEHILPVIRKCLLNNLVHRPHNQYAFNNYIIGKLIHGLNNRFLSISGSVQMLKFQIQDNPEVTETLDQLKKQNDHAIDMVMQIRGKNIRGFSSPIPNQVLDILKDSLSFWIPLITENDVKIKFSLEEPIHLIESENEELWICLGIIIQNAAQVMRESKKRILSISVQSQLFQSEPPRIFGNPKPGKFLTIRIMDTGGGIWSQDPKLIFESNVSMMGEEHGFALTIVKDFCSRNGRYLDVVTDFESGASFEIGLPIAALV